VVTGIGYGDFLLQMSFDYSGSLDLKRGFREASCVSFGHQKPLVIKKLGLMTK